MHAGWIVRRHVSEATVKKLIVSFGIASILLTGHAAFAQASPALPPDPTDKYVWLEDATGDRAMSWVKAENAKSAAVLEKDPHYAPYFAEALKVAEDPRRLPMPELQGDQILNDWRDAANPRGLLRRTTVADYLTQDPHWHTLVDFDALGKAEKVGWVSRGLTCLYPGDRFCMVDLSAGGEDAVTSREFDMKSGQFVPNGFLLSHSKQSVAWVDPDTLLVERDWGPGTMTTSGYPFVTKEWRRGTPLDSAREIFRGAPTDVSAGASVLHDAQGEMLEVFTRGVSFFENKTFVRTPRGIEPLAIPSKSNLAGLLKGRLLVELHEDWTPAGSTRSFHQGSLVELRLADVLSDPAHLKPAIVFEPSAQEFLDSEATTRDRLVVTTLEHVQGRAYVYTLGPGGWTKLRLPVPDNVSVGIVSTNVTDERFFLDITGFLTPSRRVAGRRRPGNHPRSQKPAGHVRRRPRRGRPV